MKVKAKFLKQQAALERQKTNIAKAKAGRQSYGNTLFGNNQGNPLNNLDAVLRGKKTSKPSKAKARAKKRIKKIVIYQ